MTSANTARQIDREEFEAHARAVRERALAYAAECRAREAAKVASFIVVEKKPLPIQHRRFNRAVNIMAFGVERTMSEWAAFTGINRNTIEARLRSGKTIEQALSKPVAPRRHGEAQE